jgi:LysM repeat protein
MHSRSNAPVSGAPDRHDTVAGPARRTRRTIALTTALGAAAAATMTLAAPAEAAPSNAVWDRVAKCESGNRWHINTGNGFYGGVQFSSSTWSAYHGRKYAHQANKASRVEQIEVARRVLKAQGPGAWPVCGPRAGLTKKSGRATSTALPKVAGKTTPAKHKAKARKVRAAPAKKSRAHTYRVHSGDTLSKIARKYHIKGGWRALYRANHTHLSNPNRLKVGQRLTLP